MWHASIINLQILWIPYANLKKEMFFSDLFRQGLLSSNMMMRRNTRKCRSK
jgi:hypothetical protein